MTCSLERAFKSFLSALVLLTAIGVSQIAIAGDQDGVSGYKFKIYDQDGDGVDGNEPASPFGSAQGGISLAEKQQLTPKLVNYTFFDPRVLREFILIRFLW